MEKIIQYVKGLDAKDIVSLKNLEEDDLSFDKGTLRFWVHFDYKSDAIALEVYKIEWNIDQRGNVYDRELENMYGTESEIIARISELAGDKELYEHHARWLNKTIRKISDRVVELMNEKSRCEDDEKIQLLQKRINRRLKRLEELNKEYKNCTKFEI